MKLLYVLSVLLFIFTIHASCDQQKASKFNPARYMRVLNAIRVILYGEEEGDDLEDVTDMFIDTKTGALSSLGTVDQSFTVDEILRILIQSIVIVITQKRYELLPKDFADRHKEFGFVMKHLNVVFDNLKRGTDKVSIGDLQSLIKAMSKDEFWQSFDDMYHEVKQKELKKKKGTIKMNYKYN